MWKAIRLNNGKYAIAKETGFLFWKKRHYLCNYGGCPMEFSDEQGALIAINHAEFLTLHGYMV